MNKYLIALTMLLMCCGTGYSQRKYGKDTTLRYLDDRLMFTKRSNAMFPALQVPSGDHWLLFSAYADTSSLLKIYFLDKDLQIKDGPFTIYHPKHIKAMEGRYQEDIKQGVWRYWYPNGQLKDSGAYKNNFHVGLWKSWDDSGRLVSAIHYMDTGRVTYIVRGDATDKQRKQYILARDTAVASMNGPAVRYAYTGFMRDSGAYTNNLKKGLWKVWYKDGVLESTGKYVNNQMEGEWEFFREDGTRSTKEKYMNSKVVSLECFDEQGNPAGSNCSVRKPAVPLGKFDNFDQYALDNMFWPKELKDVIISGDVIVAYTISKEGKMIDLRIVKAAHPAMGTEVIRFFNTLTEWSPAISHNRPVEYTGQYKVPFYK